MFDSVREEVAKLSNENRELRTNLESTQAKLDEAQKIIASHDDKIVKLSDTEPLSERVRILEDEARKHNLIIEGFIERKEETSERLLTDIGKLFEEKLDFSTAIEECRRLGKKTPAAHVQSLSVFGTTPVVLNALNVLFGSEEQIFTSTRMYLEPLSQSGKERLLS